MDSIKVLVLGESNTVMKGGWLDGFRSCEFPFFVESRSIGGSGILNVIFQLCLMGDEIKKYDVILLDHLINDSEFYADDPGFYTELIGRVYSYISSFGKVCVVLGFQHSKYLLEGTENSVLPLLRKEVYKWPSTYFYDFNEKLFEKCAFNLGSYRDAFMDKTHPRREVSHELGVSFAEYFKASIQGWMDVLDGSSATHGFLPFLYIGLSSCETAVETFDIKTSLVALEAIYIKEDEVLLNVAHDFIGGSLIGMFVDATKCAGLLSVKSESDCLVKSFIFKQALNQGGMALRPLVWARPVKNRIAVGRKLKVSALGSSILGFESTIAAVNRIDNFTLLRPSVGLLGLILMS